MKRIEDVIYDTLLKFEKEIIQRANQKNQNVSNKIPKSFEIKIESKKDMILGSLSAWQWTVAAWETGRGKRKSTVKTDFEEKLAKWIKRKGLKISAASLRYLINKKGTLLHQGKDNRFSGNRSGTISDFINDKSVDEFTRMLGKAIVEAEITPLLDFRTK